MKNLFTIILFLSYSARVGGQIVVLQPGLVDGKDAIIDTTSTLNPQIWYVPRGTDSYAEFGVNWCYPDGFNVICWDRFLIDFDLSILQADTTFLTAKLIFFTWQIYPNPVTRVAAFNIFPITSDWDENTVLWSNQPQYDLTTLSSFSINDTISDSIVIDISPLLKARLLLPDSSYGFMVDFAVWNMPGSVVIYTSEFSDSTKHPKLVVEYPVVGLHNLHQTNNHIMYGPNPFSSHLTFETNEEATLILYDISSWQILQQTFTSPTTINTAHLAQGIYFYEIRNEQELIEKGKLVKQ